MLQLAFGTVIVSTGLLSAVQEKWSRRSTDVSQVQYKDFGRGCLDKTIHNKSSFHTGFPSGMQRHCSALVQWVATDTCARTLYSFRYCDVLLRACDVARTLLSGVPGVVVDRRHWGGFRKCASSISFARRFSFRDA